MQKELLGRYVNACDVHHAPLPQWYAGHEAIRTLFEWAFKPYVDFRLLPIKANPQPAYAAYSRARAGARLTAHSIQVLTLEDGAISRPPLFGKPNSPHLFEAFRLPPTLEDGTSGHAVSTLQS
jgi:RNA polymerase sigma-70 factor, ECF subfamily